MIIHTTILLLAIIIDLIFGEPPNKYHTTVWIGRLIGYIKPKLKSIYKEREIVNGLLGALLIILLVGIISYLALLFISLNEILMIVAGSIMLKLTISIKGMEEHAMRVINSLHDLTIARKELSMIVGRDTSSLDEEHILSAVIESISESTTDGINSALFYYSLFGIIGAFIYRAINTLDSMVGYKDAYNHNIGYFSAKLDTVVNYIPARLTGFITILASILLNMDWRNGLKILLRDNSNTPSLNSGWSMAGVAGVLRIRLEKIGYYKLGDPLETITIEHCYNAIRLMKVITILFILIIVLPLLLIRVYIINWDFI
jgi:adenosylcobinamide-phosphate synthase